MTDGLPVRGQLLLLGSIFAVALVLSGYQVAFGTVPPMMADSESYLTFSPIRTAGYPLFLNLTGAQGALIAQPALYAAALGYFALESYRLSGNLLFAAVLALAVAVNPEFNAFHAVIMTESLSGSLLLVFLGATIRYVRRPDVRAAALLSIIAGLSAAVRPGAYALLPVVVLMLFMTRRRFDAMRRAIIVAAVGPMLVLVAGERLYTGWMHGEAATSLAGRHFYAKAAMIDAPAAVAGSDTARNVLVRALNERFAPVRALIAAAPSADIRRVLVVHYESCAQYGCVQDLRNQAGGSEVALNVLALRIGFERIAQAPLAYGALTWTHLSSMWVLYSQSHPDLSPAYAAFIAAHRPLPLEAKVPGLLDATARGPIAAVARPLFIAIGIATGLLAVLGVLTAMRGGAGPLLSVALLSALTAHLTLMLTALVGLGLVRYMIAVWPAITAALGFGAWWLLQTVLSRRRSA